ncbi:hypothetical protein ENTCAN_07540 [Enterobacter cancerogenus ATCC 35316]|nr:hypothetical protein ENTCAN_07540 [Enterobacter cancerogenus ATCC 35316]
MVWCPHHNPLPQGEGENPTTCRPGKRSATGQRITCGLVPSPQPSPTGRGATPSYV